MPNFKHVVKSEYNPTFRTKKVEGSFDIHPDKIMMKEWDVNLPIEDKEWSIGLIVGASGSGKTTIARKCFSDNLFDEEKLGWGNDSFINSYDKSLSVEDITKSLSYVGLSSVPSWFTPYSVLSNGEKFRANLSRAILENELVVYDEFTSVVDRTVAKSSSAAVSKFIKRENKKFIAVTCHYDVEEYLQPDWVYDVSTNVFKWGCLRRPEIEITVRKADTSEWELFRKHHYLNHSINKAAQCFIAEIDGRPCAFTSYLHFPHPKVKNMKKAHRTVCLPDFQGLGIGSKLSDWVGDYVTKKGFRFSSVTSHPAMISHRNKHKNWKLKRVGRVANIGKSSSVKKLKSTGSESRNTASFEYVQ